jgi:bacteriorhodopsin
MYKKKTLEMQAPTLTGIPFNDAYRYMDWLLTVPLLLIEIVLVVNMSAEESSKKCWSLGVSSALMIIIGYPGELYFTPETVGKRLMYWAAAMVPFIYIVYELVVGLSAATNSEKDPKIRSAIRNAQLYTVFSWCTYPIVYIIPIFGAQGSSAVCGIQVGYCVSDIISKCGVGLLIYNVSVAKTKAIAEGSLLA